MNCDDVVMWLVNYDDVVVKTQVAMPLMEYSKEADLRCVDIEKKAAISNEEVCYFIEKVC